MAASKTTKRASTRRAPRSTVETQGEAAVLAAIAKMPAPYRAMGGRLHAIIRTNAPSWAPRTWYGMPAYASGAHVVCYFRGGDKFGERYMTLGFNDSAHLDDGRFWPVVFALTELTPAEEDRIATVVRRAAG